MKTYFFENLFLKAFLFASKTKFSRKTFFENILEKKKKNFEFFFSLVFGSFGPPLKKGKMNYFLGKKVLDPHFFRKQIFFSLKRFWKQFPYNFWKQILFHAENNFCSCRKQFFIQCRKQILYSAENRKANVKNSVIKQIFVFENKLKKTAL